MKKCLKYLINCCTRRGSKMGKEEKIGSAMGGIIGIIVAISVFVVIDKVPATTADYEPMEKQVILIQQNPDLLFNTDGNIYINDGVITVNLANDECKLTAQYDQNFEVLSISKKDNYTFWLSALGVAVVIGFLTYSIVCVVMMIVVCLLEFLWEVFAQDFKLTNNIFP